MSAGLKQGWAFSWRSLMAAELIAVAPSLGPGIGAGDGVRPRGHRHGRSPSARIIIILIIGIGINRLIFVPIDGACCARGGWPVDPPRRRSRPDPPGPTGPCGPVRSCGGAPAGPVSGTAVRCAVTGSLQGLTARGNGQRARACSER